MQTRRAAFVGCFAVVVATSIATSYSANLAEARAAFDKTDREMNVAWNAAKGALGAAEVAVLAARQREWLAYREQIAKREAADAGEKEGTNSVTYYTTAATMTKERTEWLRAHAKRVEGLTGRWIDSYGGEIKMLQQDGRLFFAFEVVRGPASHVGGLAGVASWNDKLGWFSDKGRDAGKEDESNLVFIDRGEELEVVGANTSYYHGAHAYFDGFYCKVGELTEQAQGKLKSSAEAGQVPEQER